MAKGDWWYCCSARCAELALPLTAAATLFLLSSSKLAALRLVGSIDAPKKRASIFGRCIELAELYILKMIVVAVVVRR